MAWLASGGAVAVAAAVVFVPGLLVAVALRLRGLTALALAGPIGFGAIGVSGVLFGLVHVRFGWYAPLIIAAGAAAVTVVLRAVLGRRGRRHLPAWDSWRPAQVLPVVGGALVATAAIGLIAFGAVPSADRVSQTYDAVFHLNAAQSILQTGDASSLHLYRLTHPLKSTAFYPAVWHSIVAMTAAATGVSIPVATNAAWIATAGPVFSLGSAFLAATLFGHVAVRRDAAPPVQRTLVAATAAVLASGFTAFPYLLLDFGTLYPNGLAYTTLPVGLALVVAVVPWPVSAAWRPEQFPPRWRVVLLTAVWLLAAAFTHPRSIVALVALALPPLVAWFGARMRAVAATGPGGRRRARLGWAGFAGGAALVLAGGLAVVYRYYDVAHRPIADRLNGGPAMAREGFGQAFGQGLLSTSLVSPTQDALPVPVLLAAVVLAGLLALAARPGLRWPVVGYLVVVLLYAAAAGSDSDLAKLATGLWDKDKFRIIAMLPTLAVPIAAWIAVAGAIELATALRGADTAGPRRRSAVPVAAAGTAAALVAVAAWSGGATGTMTHAVGSVFALDRSVKHGRLLDEDQVALLSRVGRTVPAGQVIVDDPWNGSTLAWAIGGRETLFPHFGGYWGTRRKLIARHLDEAATDPAVCRAVRALDLHWLVSDRQRLAGFHHEQSAFDGIRRAADGPGVQLVDSQGSAALYRITACWR